MARGGARSGAGRPRAGTREVTIRLSPTDHELLKQLGSSNFVRYALDAVRNKKMTIKLNLDKLTEEQKDAFTQAFINAGGPNDAEIEGLESPWCAPWYYESTIEVEGSTAAEWGASWWTQNRDEIDSLTPLFVLEKVVDDWTLNVTTVLEFRQANSIEDFQCWYRQEGTLDNVKVFVEEEKAKDFIFKNIENTDRQYELVQQLKEF